MRVLNVCECRSNSSQVLRKKKPHITKVDILSMLLEITREVSSVHTILVDKKMSILYVNYTSI